MYQNFVSARRLFFCAITGGLLLSFDACFAQTAGKQVVSGSLPAAIGNLHLQPLRDLPATNRLNLAIGLPLRNKAALDLFLQQLQDPASTNYHRYLTPQEFTVQFGPSQKDYDAVVNFAKTNGLTVTQTYSNRALVDVAGDVKTVERVFHVKMHVYRHPTENRNFFAPDGDPSVDLDVPILQISGLNNFIIPHPAFVKKNNLSGVRAASGSGPDGFLMGADFRNAYIPGVALNGSGQTVGLFELEGFFPSDITAYENIAGLRNVPLEQIPVDGFPGVNSVDTDGITEVSLDIEMDVALATNLSSVIVYEEVNGGNIVDLLNRIASDDLTKQISSSWLIGDSSSYDTAYKQMASQGQSFLQASGDDGAYYSGHSGTIPEWADDTNITIVGGTTLSMNGSGSSYSSETVWNWYTSGEGSAASGGGVNFNRINIPSWQTGISMSGNGGSTTRRDVPDVAMNADNVFIVANGDEESVGGTSAAAPLWAAFTALVNERAAIFGDSPMGFLNPKIYAIGKGAGYATNFNDITTGNNTTPEVSNKYYAETGYDLCTGWGSPAGQNLLSTLVSPDTLTVAPLSGFDIAGPWSGPFSPSTETFDLTNATAAPISWSLISTSVWLSVSSPGGMLDDGASTNEAITIAPAADSLVPGAYEASVQFSNWTSHVVQTLPFFLQLTEPLAIAPSGTNSISGGPGGSFSMTSVDFTLTNLGTAAINWQAGTTSAWLDVSAPAGALAGGGQTNVTVSLNSAASNLLVGAYSTIVSFTNQTLGTVQTRPFILNVTEPLDIGPSGATDISGDVGGPFSMTSVDFTLTNLGTAAINWQAGTTSAWLNVSAAAGTLAGGGQTNVTVSLNSATSNLVAGVYSTMISFTNQTFGSVQTRQLILSIGASLVLNGGFETGDFTDWSLDGDAGNYNFVDSGITVTAIEPHSGSYFAALGESGFLAYLSQTLPTLPGRSYLISLWMNSPNVSPYEPNEFSVAWNGNTLFDQVNIPPITSPANGWTNLEFIVTATNGASVLQIGGRDDDYYLGLDDVSVVPVPPVMLQTGSLAVTTNGIGFSWNAISNVTYQIQYLTNLFQTNWVTLQTITATNSSINFTDTNPVAGSPQKYYRLLLLP